MKKGGVLKVGLKEIYKILPHRYPFLFIDGLIDLIPGKKATGIKEITFNEDFLIYAPALIIEAMAQVAGITLAFDRYTKSGPIPSLEKTDDDNYEGYLAEIKDLSFYGDIKAGDILFLDIELALKFGSLFRFKGRVVAEDKLIAEGEFSIALARVIRTD